MTDPINLSQSCVVSNGTGSMTAADLGNINVTCTTNTFVVSGTLSGLDAGNTIVLQNNGKDDLTLTGDGDFNFSTPIPDGSDYEVTLLSLVIGYTTLVCTPIRKPELPQANCKQA